MNKILSKYIYFILSATLIIFGLIVKYFLIDKDFGTRFNKEILHSDIIFLTAVLFCLIGLVFHAFKKNNKLTLKDSTITTSAILILPFSITLALNPNPGGGDNFLASMLIIVFILSLLAAFIWIILIIVTFGRQAFIILASKGKQ